MTVTLLSLLVLLEGGGVHAADETCSLLQAHVPNVHVGPYPIPCTIHQTAKTHYLEGSDAKWADTWRQKNPDCAYKLWNDTEIAELARTKSPDVVWPIWEGLSGVERADVFRYLVLWVHGGYYADVDVECLKPIATYQVPKDVSMLVGFEYGHRHQEFQRVAIKYARTEQFQQWFIASAPKSPVLERVLHMIRQRFSWKITSTLDLTGPGVFSDAVHEFLASSTSEAHFLSFKSEEEYGGDFKVWVFAAGRVNAAPQVAQDDPNEGKEPLIEHHFEGSWKEDKDWELKDLKKRHQNIALFAW